MPEDKHIYTSSRWVKFLNGIKSFIKSIKKFRPKFSKPRSKISFNLTQPLPPSVLQPPTKVVPAAPKSTPKPKTQRSLPHISIKPKHFKIKTSETGEKILVYTLVFAVIAIIMLGIFLSSINF